MTGRAGSPARGRTRDRAHPPAAQSAGRFAPSPTGPLHAGSLVAAVASWLDARERGERWLVRMDDLDPPRIEPGAADAILQALERHGLVWDGPVIRQSDRLDGYRAALDALGAAGRLFYCRCSRRELKGTRVYPGTCRTRQAPRADAAVRVAVADATVEITDLVQGHRRWRLATDAGDFVVRRRDGLIAYQLATAVDDGAPEIRRVIRGADLLDETPRQLYLMGLLGLDPPEFGHVPVLVNRAGEKLSKQTGARALDPACPSANLARTMSLLGMTPPADADRLPPAELLAWGVRHWDLSRVPQGPAVAQDSRAAAERPPS